VTSVPGRLLPKFEVREAFKALPLGQKIASGLGAAVSAIPRAYFQYAKKTLLVGPVSDLYKTFTVEGQEKRREEKAIGINVQYFEKRLGEIEAEKQRYDTMIKFHTSKSINNTLTEPEKLKHAKKLIVLTNEKTTIDKLAAIEKSRLENKLAQALTQRVDKNKQKATTYTPNTLKKKGQNNNQTRKLQGVLESQNNLGKKITTLKNNYEIIRTAYIARKQKELGGQRQAVNVVQSLGSVPGPSTEIT
jgi:hypothetical protein